MKWTKVAKKLPKDQLIMQYTDNKLTKEPCIFLKHVFNIQSISVHLLTEKNHNINAKHIKINVKYFLIILPVYIDFVDHILYILCVLTIHTI